MQRNNSSLYHILILGMGGDVSKGIYKAVKESEVPCKIIGACISSDSDGLYFCDKAYISPYADTEEFIPWLISICNLENIDIVLTGVEENIAAISKSLDVLHLQTKSIFRVCTVDQLEIGGDKYKTCQWLKANGFPYPRFCRTDNSSELEEFLCNVNYPFIVKPRNGKSSIGVQLVHNPNELETIKSLSNYVAEEYVGTSEQEYTVGCYYGLHGEVPDPIVMHRKLKNGSSKTVEVVENQKISNLAKEICMKFKPDGPLNIQLRLADDGTPVPFELNVRFSGTTPMRSHFGFCDVQAMIYESLLGRPIEECFHISTGMAFRYSEEFYIKSRNVTSNGEIFWDK